MQFFRTWSPQHDASAIDVTGGEGHMICLADGTALYDAISCNFQASFGYSAQPIIHAIQSQLLRMPVANPKHDHTLKTQVSQRLCDLVTSDPGRIFYTVSGAEAIENALKMARQVTGRERIVARTRSYHGATMGAMSVTGDWRGQGHFGVQSATIRIPEPADDPDAEQAHAIIRAAGPDSIAACCFETISGMNGVIIPPHSWWQRIAAICRTYGILLIVDEVSCGFGRTGTAFAMHHYGIHPDFVCMAKAITGGYIPFGAVWVNEAVASWYDTRMLSAGLTAYAHPLGLAACNAVLDILHSPAFQQHLTTTSTVFATGIATLATHPRVQHTRQIGMMAAVDLAPDDFIRWEDGVRHGLHLAVKANTVVLAPPLTSTPDECTDILQRLTALLDEGVPRE